MQGGADSGDVDLSVSDQAETELDAVDGLVAKTADISIEVASRTWNTLVNVADGGFVSHASANTLTTAQAAALTYAVTKTGDAADGLRAFTVIRVPDTEDPRDFRIRQSFSGANYYINSWHTIGSTGGFTYARARHNLFAGYLIHIQQATTETTTHFRGESDAENVAVDTTNFDQNLDTCADVQACLETIDGFSQYQGLWQQASWPAGVIVTRSGIAYISLVNNNTQIPTPESTQWSGLPEGFTYRGDAPVAATNYNYGHLVRDSSTDNYYVFTSTVSASVTRADIPTHTNFAPLVHVLTPIEAASSTSTVYGAVSGMQISGAIDANDRVCPDPSTGTAGQVCATDGSAYELVDQSGGGGGGGGTDDQTAAEVPYTSDAGGNLPATITEVQAALDEIDDFELENTFRGAYDSNRTYDGGEMVIYNGLEYISLIRNNTREPTRSEEQWSAQPRGYIFRGDAPVAATTYQESHVVRVPAQNSWYICTFQGGVSVTRAQIAAGHANFAPFTHRLTDAQVNNSSATEKGVISGSQLDDFAPELGIAEVTSRVIR